MEFLQISFFIILSLLATSKICDLIFGTKTPKIKITNTRLIQFSVEYIYRLKNNSGKYRKAPTSEYESFGEEFARWLIEKQR